MLNYESISHWRQKTWAFERKFILGGAIEPYCHSEAFKSYQVTTYLTLKVCAKFSHVSSILHCLFVHGEGSKFADATTHHTSTCHYDLDREALSRSYIYSGIF